MPFAPQESLAVGGLEFEPPDALCEGSFHRGGLGERRQQRVRLGDLRHFGRRRKAFKRGGENGVRFGGAGRRLIELRQRERGAQAEAACPLLARDGDGGLEGFLSRRGIGGIAPEQQFATNAVKLGFEGSMTSPFGRRQRVVEDGDSAVDIVGASFRFGEGIWISPSNITIF